MIICIGNTKGGCGKTTIATNLAVLSAISKKSTLLIDSDLQGSSSDWRSYRSDDLAPVKCVKMTTPTIHKDIKSFQNFDNIFIDAGGRDGDTFRSAIMACDLLLVPMTPSPYDVWSSEDTLKMLAQARVYKEIKTKIVLNMVISNTNLSKEIEPLLAEFSKEYSIEICKAILGSRQDFKKSAGEGRGVPEFAPKTKADEEIKALFKEIMSC